MPNLLKIIIPIFLTVLFVGTYLTLLETSRLGTQVVNGLFIFVIVMTFFAITTEVNSKSNKE